MTSRIDPRDLGVVQQNIDPRLLDAQSLSIDPRDAVPLSGIPDFPQTIPANTVLGRTGIDAGPVQALPLSLFQTGGGVVNAGDSQWGIIGDGVTDDGPAINAMSAAAVATGATKIVFPSGKTFRTTSTNIKPRQNLIWDGQGSTFVTGVGFPTIPLGIFGNNADSTKTFIGNVTGASVTGPTDQLTLSSVTGLSIGNWIAVRLGLDPYDNTEPFYSFVAQVTNIAGVVITFDWVIPYNINFGAYTYIQKDPNSAAAGGNISVPSTPTNSNSNGNKSVFLLTTDMAVNLTFRDMVLVGDQNGLIEGGIGLTWGANLRFENIVGNPGDTGDMGAGLFVLQFCRNVRIDKAYLGYNANTSGQASKGRMFSFASCEDVVVSNHFSKDLKSLVGFSEDLCDKITFVNPVDVFNKDTVGAGFIGYGFNTRANGEIINPTAITSIPSSTTTWIYVGNAASDGDFRISGTFKWRGPLAYTVIHAANKLDCIFDYDDPTIGYARIDFFNKRTVAFRIPLVPNMTGAITYQIPGGVSDIDIMASSGVTVATVTSLALSSPGVFYDFHTSLIAGSVVNVSGTGLPRNSVSVLGSIFGGIANWTGQTTTLFVGTSAAAQADGNFIGIVARVPRILEANIGVFGPTETYALTDDQMCLMLNGTPQRIVESGLTVASLPAAGPTNKGMRRLVTDATATTFWSIVAGGGANTVPVSSDGTNWRIG